MNKKILRFAVSIIIPQLAGLIGSLFTIKAISTWYATLPKPALTPPSWIFGPVWTLLYILMGIALFLVWSSYSKASEGQEKKNGKIAMWVFSLQLILNALWSISFFGLQNPGLGLINIVLLWLAILWTIVRFYKVSRPAAYLLIPYILWVSFATYLNYSIWEFFTRL